jgi:hypothetical protein
VLQLSGRLAGDVKELRNGNPTRDLKMAADRTRPHTPSYVERSNLTLRMQLRRFTRLTNGFSKKLENLKSAVSLYMAWYNFVRIHGTLKVTPAMEAGLTDHVWNLTELLSATDR